MRSHLESTLSSVNDWLKFAEAKNAVLGALDGAVLVAIIQLILGERVLQPGVVVYLLIGAICCVVCLFLVFFSFLPRTRIPLFADQGARLPSDNLLFFGDIAKYSPDEYLERVAIAYGCPKPAEETAEKWMTEEIIANSRIALRKYKLFTCAMWFMLAGVATPILVLFLWLIKSPNGCHMVE